MMSSRPWIAVFLIFAIIVSLALILGFWAYWQMVRPPSVVKNTIVEIVVGGSLYEVTPENPFVEIFESSKPSLYDLWELFELSSQDDDVSSIYLEVQPLDLSFAQIEELREGMHKFRASGKKIHAFLSLDMAGESEIYLASAADTLSINPEAGLLLNGLIAEIQFYKRSLQKLGIKPEFIQFKEFKSPEQYGREDLSESVRSMLESILGDMELRFVKSVASDRGIEESVLREIINLGMINAQGAVERQLVDEAGYRNQVQERLSKEAGRSNYKAMRASDYLAVARGRRSSEGPLVALIGATGTITSGKSDSFGQTLDGSSMAERLRALRKSRKYDAVLLRVNSPGGSVVGSDMVWHEVQLLEKAGIPVIVSMSAVAGSGGYYIAMAASKIISQPSTITGSIGVIFGKFNVAGLYDWLGISVDRVKTSPNADLFSFSSSLTPQQRERIVAWMEEIYDSFVSKAAQGRAMDFVQLEEKARGRIYTGKQALDLGLVDDIGGFPKALEYVRAALELEDNAPVRLIRVPKPKSVWEALSELGSIHTPQTNPVETWVKSELRGHQTPRPHLLVPRIQIH